MKRFILAAIMIAGCAWAEGFSGYIADSHCAKDAAKASTPEHAKCAQTCIKNGAKAVLLTEAGKVTN